MEIDPIPAFYPTDPGYQRDENDTASTMKRSTLFTSLEPGKKYNYRAVLADKWVDYGTVVTPVK